MRYKTAQEAYKGQLVHIICSAISGTIEYIGVIGECSVDDPHWWRIEDPFHHRKFQVSKGSKGGPGYMVSVQRFGGDFKWYTDFVEFEVPDEAAIEIRVIDQSSQIMEVIEKERKRYVPDGSIHIPGNVDNWEVPQ